MIRYALQCDKDHTFESWFKNSEAFDNQVERGLVECPACGSRQISKAIMAPQVARTDREVVRVPAATADQAVAVAEPQAAMLREKIREFREFVLRNSNYVGDQFAEEARRIHFGESEKRSIHGEATGEDVRSLLEDGIEVHPIPVLPDDRN